MGAAPHPSCRGRAPDPSGRAGWVLLIHPHTVLEGMSMRYTGQQLRTSAWARWGALPFLLLGLLAGPGLAGHAAPPRAAVAGSPADWVPGRVLVKARTGSARGALGPVLARLGLQAPGPASGGLLAVQGGAGLDVAAAVQALRA